MYLLRILGPFSRSWALDGPPASIELLALRAAIVFFDVLMVAALYRLGRHVAGHTIATWTALMYALCPGSIYL